MDIERKKRNDMRAEETMQSSSKSRRRASKIITDAALDYERRRLRGITRSIAERLSLKDEKERKRAEQILLDAEEKAGLAALVWLREFNVPIYNACIYSAMNFAQKSLLTEKATEFKFLSPKELNTQRRSFFLPFCLEIYSRIVNDLQAAFKPIVEGGSQGQLRRKRKQHWRFGEAQQLGFLRHMAEINARATAVLDTAKKHVEEELRPIFQMPEITERLAKKWVRDLETPNRVAMQILAYLTRREPRTIKALLNKSRKISKLPPWF